MTPRRTDRRPTARRRYLNEGAKRAPTRRNLYYVGVISYQTGEYTKAISFFERALKAPVSKEPSSTEVDIAQFLLTESEKGLRESKAALAKLKG